MYKLNQLKIGDKATLQTIEDDLEIKKRLLDMGFTKGSLVECVRKAAFCGPVAYKIKNTIIALRDSDSKKIHVEVVHEY